MTEMWPEDIANTPRLLPPIAVLKSAATELSRKTNGLLRGHIETRSFNPAAGSMTHTFYILASVLDDYQYEILVVSHSIELYPVSIDPRSGIVAPGSLTAASPESLERILKDVFATQKVKDVVQSLMAQSQAA